MHSKDISKDMLEDVSLDSLDLDNDESGFTDDILMNRINIFIKSDDSVINFEDEFSKFGGTSVKSDERGNHLWNNENMFVVSEEDNLVNKEFLTKEEVLLTTHASFMKLHDSSGNDDSFTTLSIIEENSASDESLTKENIFNDDDSDSAVILESGSDSIKCFGVNPLFDEIEEETEATNCSFTSLQLEQNFPTKLCRSVSDVLNKGGNNLTKSISEGNLLNIDREEESPFTNQFYRGFLLRHQKKEKRGWQTDRRGGIKDNILNKSDGTHNHW